MQNSLTNQVAIISGASRGIGRAIAKSLATQGCHVALLARSRSAVEQLALECEQLGVKAVPVPCDITDVETVRREIDRIAEKLGTINILVNNAGIGGGGRVDSADLEVWDRVIDVNLRSLMHITHYALQYIKKNSHGAIINIASIAGKMIFAGNSAYCASKHGLMGFSGSLFDEIREQNIKVCSICPGYVNTDMVAGRNLDAEKMIQPDDIAATVLFVLQFPHTGCPTEIIIRPQQSPYR